MIALWSLAALAGISGVVLDKLTGDPIVGADVALGSETAATDARGRFELADSENAPRSLEVRAEGYEVAQHDLGDLADRRLKIWLFPDPGHEVVVESFRPTAQIDRHRIDAEMALETPGTMDDAVRLVQSLPGAAVQREYSPTAGDLSVRGSLPGDNRYLFDGIEVPYLFHFRQYASVFPASWLDTLDLYPSSFGAAWGDSAGAIVDARLKAEAPAEVHGEIAVNFLTAGGEVRVPLQRMNRRKPGFWLSISGRRSYQDLAGEGSAQYTLWPVFHDEAIRIQRDHRPDSHTALFAWGAGDSYRRAAGEIDILDPVEQTLTPSFRFRQGFRIAGVEHRSGASRVVGAVVDERLRGDLTGNGRQDRRSLAFAGRADVEPYRSESVSLAVGGEWRLDRTTLLVEDPGPAAILVATEAAALARGVPIDDALTRLRAAAYAELRPVFGSVQLFPGVRVATDTAGTAISADPRAAIRWRAADQTELHAGGGLYRQAPDAELLLSDPTLPDTTAWAASLGAEQTIAGRLELGLDAYYKALSDVAIQPPGEAIAAAPAGAATGVEVLARYRLRDKFFLWADVTFARATVRMEGKTVPLPGDQPWSTGVVASWSPVRNWDFGLRGRAGAGLPYTRLTGSVYDGGEDAWVPLAGPTNGARFPAFVKIDAHVGRTFTFRGWSLLLAMEAGYVPKAASQLYPTYSYNYTEQGWVRGPVFLPLLSARARF